MYQTGDRVVYGMHGVCVVADTEERTVDGRQVRYLVLEPMGQPGSRYLLPSHNAAAMAKLRPVLTREALEELLGSKEIREAQWIPDENRRKQSYRNLVGSVDCVELLQMVCALYRYRREQTGAGRKLHMCDENFLRDAEKLLASEIAITLELPTGEARDYLRTKLDT